MFLQFLFKLFSKIFFFTGKLSNKNTYDKKLKPEEEKIYLNRIAIAKQNFTTDPEAEEKLVKHNLRLVAHIANKYKQTHNDIDDLISVGSIGLLKAVRNYDTTRTSGFSSFASKCIENEILMLLRSQKKLNNEISLDSSIATDKDGNNMKLCDTLASQDPDLSATLDKKIELSKIENCAKQVLTERELLVVANRFGLLGNLPKTQIEVANLLGISRSYISRIENSALTKIKSCIVKNN